MSSDHLLSLLNRVARSMEAVVPGLQLTARIYEPVWLAEDDAEPVDAATGAGEWVNALGFEVRYQDVWNGGFEHGSSGSDRERVLSVARELISQVQDVVAVATREPWPIAIVNGRRDMAMGHATIDGNDLHMWYGDRGTPALTLPVVNLY
jgi:hypothetical protein